MKGLNVYITDDTHSKLCHLRDLMQKSNLADVISVLIDWCYSDLKNMPTEKGSIALERRNIVD